MIKTILEFKNLQVIKLTFTMQLSKQLADRAVTCMHSPLKRTRRKAFSQPRFETSQSSTQIPTGSLAQPQHGPQSPQQPVCQPLPALPHHSAAEDWRGRTQLLVGDEALNRLADARVLVVGLGGVGSYAAEFLARAGVGSMVIVDNDQVDLSNINRQLPALHSTVGLSKADLMAQRLRDINPSLLLEVKQIFVTPETVTPLLVEGALGRASKMNSEGGSSSSNSIAQPEGLIRAPFDWVLDAIDSLTPKQLLLAAAHAVGVKTIASMGAGGRRDPSRVRVGPISSTVNDRFAANMRKSLRRFGVNLNEIMCVWSDEPLERKSLAMTAEKSRFKRSFYGTISFLPAQFGLTAAAYIVNDIIDSQTLSKRPLACSTFPSPCSSPDSAPRTIPSGATLDKRSKGGLPPSKWKALQLAEILEQYSQQQQQQQQQQERRQVRQVQPSRQNSLLEHRGSPPADPAAGINGSLGNDVAPPVHSPPSQSSPPNSHRAAVMSGLGLEGEGI
uniref:THIF-type NAD/FAD binding fold domain-containing protein n=1 Tax=Dunaliella tertiolecta TaxID=3047 RepID=A0A7S3R371_DUNTE